MRSLSELLETRWLGRIPYGDALKLQIEALDLRKRGDRGNELLLLEHPAVITLGRSTRPENVLVSEAELAELGIERHEVARGGDVTYHAPGQLVGYPIVDLSAWAPAPRDVHRFLRAIEEALIESLLDFGLVARRIEGKTGVFMARDSSARVDRKIASIGIGVRRWVSYHGFALNVSVDLAGFGVIVPCGLENVEMTSVAAELERAGRAVPGDVDVQVRAAVQEAFERRI